MPKLSEVSTLLLDMDGTLLDLNYDNYFWNRHLHQRYAEIHDLPIQQAKTHVRDTLAGQQGTLNWYCTEYWSTVFEVDILALKREVAHLIQYRDGARQFLQRLQDVHFKVLLVTNAHRDVIDLKHSHTGLLNLIPDVISSHDYGAAKESEVFWQQLTMDRDDLNISSTMLIDNNKRVLCTARDFGIAHQMAIRQPDSARDSITHEDFPMLDDFSQLEVPL